MKSASIRLFVICLLAAIFVSAASSQKRNLTDKDLFDFVWIADPQVSPDGSTVAFVKVTVNEKKDGYNTAIWSVSTAGSEIHQLTSGTRDRRLAGHRMANISRSFV